VRHAHAAPLTVCQEHWDAVSKKEGKEDICGVRDQRIGTRKGVGEAARAAPGVCRSHPRDMAAVDLLCARQRIKGVAEGESGAAPVFQNGSRVVADMKPEVKGVERGGADAARAQGHAMYHPGQGAQGGEGPHGGDCGDSGGRGGGFGGHDAPFYQAEGAASGRPRNL
jgi:hypothetical protein